VRVGHAEELLERGALTTGEWSTRIFLPEFLKRLAFMSETPFPSTAWLTSFSRNMAYSDTPHANRPIPTFAIQHQAECEGFARALSKQEGQLVHWNSLYPDVVLFGWRFGVESIQYLEDIMPTIVNGLVFAASTVEDGYRNFRTEDYPADWDSTVGSPAANYVEFERGVEAHGLPRWIAATEVADEYLFTELLWIEANQPEAIANRRDKMGFPVPLTEWAKGPLRGYFSGTLESLRDRDLPFLDGEQLTQMLQHSPRFSRGLWALVSLELWFQVFHDSHKTSTSSG
jgi:hypothetical protein